jgi:SNF2 family DNA or RNA helicase
VKVSASIDGKRIRVSFPYSNEAVAAIKDVPGRRFVPRDKGGPHWNVPLNMDTARRLRECFGAALAADEALLDWGRQELQKERNLAAIMDEDQVIELERLPHVHPELHGWLRDYQIKDIAFMAKTDCMNANQPGLGKTVEVIASAIEAGLENGPHLVIAPATSLRSVWRPEINRWLPDHLVICYSGELSKGERAMAVTSMRDAVRDGKPFWLVTTPHMFRRGLPVDGNWNTVTIDEFHKAGLCNPGTLLAKAAYAVQAQRKFALSGTPMGGHPIKLWGALHYLNKQYFNSKWQWAEQWLVVDDNGFGKDILGVQPGRGEEFNKHLSKFMIRRLKLDVAKELPPKQYINIWTEMSPGQRAQYEKFQADAEVRIDEEHVSAFGVLAEMTRLKQFANAKCKLDSDRNVIPSDDCNKLNYVLEKLEERGIRADDPEGDEVAVVASESARMVDMVSEFLNKKGIENAVIAGHVKHSERADIVKEFQNGNGPRVIVITTTAGGVSITLDKADSLHILDETWNPDDQEQLEDRLHRISRAHQVTIYYYRTKDTIQENIYRVNINKRITNKNVLDAWSAIKRVKKIEL